MSDELAKTIAAEIYPSLRVSESLYGRQRAAGIIEKHLAALQAENAELRARLDEINKKWLPAHDQVCERVEQLSDENAALRAERDLLRAQLEKAVDDCLDIQNRLASERNAAIAQLEQAKEVLETQALANTRARQTTR